MTRKARLGVIGAGWWATANYLPLLAQRDDVELVAVCRLGQSEWQRVRDRFGFRFATEDEAKLVRLAAERGLHLLVPYGWHYKPFVQTAKQWLDAGRIGTFQYVLCHMASPIRDLLRGP